MEENVKLAEKVTQKASFFQKISYKLDNSLDFYREFLYNQS
jgi:hypothetical protein